jgi:RsmE family RNA methyltransferase
MIPIIPAEDIFDQLPKTTVLFLYELTTEKAVELGVTDIIPISTDRTGKKNLDYRRLELTIKEAIEQSGRGDIPRLHSELSLEQALLFAKKNVDTCIYVATLGGTPFTSTMKPTKDFAEQKTI